MEPEIPPESPEPPVRPRCCRLFPGAHVLAHSDIVHPQSVPKPCTRPYQVFVGGYPALSFANVGKGKCVGAEACISLSEWRRNDHACRKFIVNRIHSSPDLISRSTN